MDFAALHTGAFALAATIATAFNLSLPPLNSQSPENHFPDPAVVSYNIPEETKTINSLQDMNITEDKLVMVTRKPDVEELVTVDRPSVVYTVAQPIPSPSIKPSAIPLEAEESPEPSKKPEKAKEPEKVERTETKSPEPSSVPATTIGTPNAEKLFRMINDYRVKLGKAAFEKDDRLCKIAESRAPQVDAELASGNLHKGFKDLNLPYWATENIAAYASIEDDFKFWLSDYIHKAAIESDHKYSCLACVGASCSEIFSGFVAK